MMFVRGIDAGNFAACSVVFAFIFVNKYLDIPLILSGLLGIYSGFVCLFGLSVSLLSTLTSLPDRGQSVGYTGDTYWLEILGRRTFGRIFLSYQEITWCCLCPEVGPKRLRGRTDMQ